MIRKEEYIQKNCIIWFDIQFPQYRLLLHHSPNGGYRSKVEGGIFKAMGVRAGFPDLIFLLPNPGYHYLAIEMKDDKGHMSPSQVEYKKIIEENGGKHELIRSFDEFREIITNWINNYAKTKT